MIRFALQAATATLYTALTLAAQIPQDASSKLDISRAARGPFAFDAATGELVPATPADEDPLNSWTGSVNVGATFTNGNTNRRTVAAAANATRRGEADRLTLGFSWNYADADPGVTSGQNRVITQRRTRGSGKFDQFLTDDQKLYGYLGVSAEGDTFADLDLRLVVTTGLGCQFIESDAKNFSGEVGVGFYQEDRKVGMDDDYIAARIAYHFDWQFRDNMQFLQDVEYIPGLENGDDAYVRKDSQLKVTLTENMFGLLQWVLDYDNTPSGGLNRIDNLFLINIGWNF